MQVPSLRFFVFFVARSGVALWTPFLIYFWPHVGSIWGPQIKYFGVTFWTPQKVGYKSEKDATTEIRRSQEAAGERWRAAPGRGKGRGKPFP